MDERARPHLWGRERRYMLTELLWERGPMTVAELGASLAADGWRVGGRASKTISDALRWEIAHGWVVRLGRGLYGPGRMPKQTKSWIRGRNRRTREEAREHLAVARHDAAHPGPRAAQPERAGGRHPTDQPLGSPATAPTWSGPAVPHGAGAGEDTRPRARPSRPQPSRRSRATVDDEVVVVGGGWSEADDVAEDEALCQRLLARSGSGRVSGGST